MWTSSPVGSLAVTIRDLARISRYEFGTRTAQFHICSTCGIVPVVTTLIAGRLYGVVSVNVLEGLDAAQIHAVAASFEDEAADERLGRRAKSWIPGVRMQAIAPGQ